MVVEGVSARIDAGAANGRAFSVMVSRGFDADVVRRVHARRIDHVNDFSYFKPIAEAIWNCDFPEIRVPGEDDGDDVPPLSARWLFAINLPPTAAGFGSRPQAHGPTGCWIYALSAVAIFGEGSVVAARCSASIIACPTAPPVASAGCESPPMLRCLTSSTATPADCCRWTFRCCPAG